MSGIYIHIPYCKQACSYCDFHFSTSLKTKERFLDALLLEIELRAEFLENKHLDSLYFGGGTPSLLSVDEWVKIREKLSTFFSWESNAEITMEINPDDVEWKKMKQLVQEGVNRFSVGIQSFSDQDLVYMNRAHNSKEAIQALETLNELENVRISADLIFGTPTTSDHDLIKNIEILNKYDNIVHISAYALTVEEKTPLEALIRRGLKVNIDSEHQKRQFDIVYNKLIDCGFQHYEISNYAKPGFEAVHNSSYWKGIPYLGLGPSAHSFNGDKRVSNVSNNLKYINGISSGETVQFLEVLTPENKFNEYLLTSLRTKWGVDILYVKKYHNVFYHDFMSVIDDNMSNDWFLIEEDKVYLTRQGKHFADQAALLFFK